MPRGKVDLGEWGEFDAINLRERAQLTREWAAGHARDAARGDGCVWLLWLPIASLALLGGLVWPA